jgi:hypothetical protein
MELALAGSVGRPPRLPDDAALIDHLSGGDQASPDRTISLPPRFVPIGVVDSRPPAGQSRLVVLGDGDQAITRRCLHGHPTQPSNRGRARAPPRPAIAEVQIETETASLSDPYEAVVGRTERWRTASLSVSEAGASSDVKVCTLRASVLMKSARGHLLAHRHVKISSASAAFHRRPEQGPGLRSSSSPRVGRRSSRRGPEPWTDVLHVHLLDDGVSPFSGVLDLPVLTR